MTVPPTADLIGIPDKYMLDYERGREITRHQFVASGIERAIALLDVGKTQQARDLLRITLAGTLNTHQQDYIAEAGE